MYKHSFYSQPYMALLFIDVLGGAGSATESSSSGEISDDDEEGEGNEEDEGEMKIQDETQMNTMALRRTIYLTIMSSLSFEECAHKMLQMSVKPGQEVGGAINYGNKYSFAASFLKPQ